MEKTKQPIRVANAVYYLLAKMLERGVYYGLRSIVVLYMVDKTLQMDMMEVAVIFKVMTASLLLSQLFGALLGDLLIGNKRAIFIGGIIQATGAFAFCIPTITGLYIGIFLVVFGNGLFFPNIIANYGKLFLNAPNVLDSAFSSFYVVINIGAFLGVLFFGMIVNYFGYNTAFITAGIVMCVSLLLILFVKENDSTVTQQDKESQNKRIGYVFFAFIMAGSFWLVYNVTNIQLVEIQRLIIEDGSLKLSGSIMYSIGLYTMLFVGILAAIIWSKWHTSHFFKLLLGFVFASVAIQVVSFSVHAPADEVFALYIVAIVCMVLAEIHIAPVVFSIMTRYINPKYLAICVSFAMLPASEASIITGTYDQFYTMDSLSILRIISVITFVSILCVGAFLWWYRRTHRDILN
ncbi:MFS transporter [Kordia zhangzhouensis]|uniref:MFS transporter n=1 Tax=Kordia zhangzhouensis TaxID=1620405 RepID=UPI0006294472|nr:MFS transporter [Kordia zhangzhouensis]